MKRMFKSLRPSNVVVPITSKFVKVSYNNEKCYKCDSKDNLSVNIENGGSTAYCNNCEMDIVLFKYISEKEYRSIIKESRPMIKKDTMNNFIKNSII